MGVARGSLQNSDLTAYIKKRDRSRYLEVDSSPVNVFLLDILLQEFLEARFILTIRDCYSWLDSIINHSLLRPTSPEWQSFRDFRFSSHGSSHSQQEKILKTNKLYTLDGYLSFWAMPSNRVLSKVPKEKLLIVKTNEIGNFIDRIDNFSGLPQDCLVPENAHSFRNPKKFRILRKINHEYLEKKVKFHCAALMERFFPNIRSLSDAGL